ncbi:NTP transferase domain-containing protein [Methermicoccus shengliensis]|uniref:Bifunctional IPC transferase and DIPP synthase n=1 Tax=Methermicoccus shengliensis TaxID=660064 RepID=A0A832RXM4_9EURY|nr:MAG: Glucose-1-phosphate thymidylyltransferase [Euryarchaeota archaeon 55_53]KUK29623.1 MAG: Glucose-1-phosphate thymidylyltransferase [Methanosarcinales archeaon 56_1174]MDI3487761.1 1L-myo-inositol 1-phosphate cytidylyltransferase / CDP-L-myo-inositol myo-inositolphosphotransferase [Methanosarcinales archaeon]MDN5294883.1 1L-myo-inositol 1-phosphate cytidylyltransferase / CDP-L-myo-inositol myo-inositolphosphotransferase [Methanosarcinales archaeon]HIH70073.1 NTP transferase domain-contain
MKVLILAAGIGKRMSGRGIHTPKPLLKLFGIPLIEHTLRKLLAYGFSSSDIVVVYHSDEVGEFLRSKFPSIGLIHNSLPKKGNGYSLFLARERIDEDFVLLMSDHYYADGFFEILTEAISGSCSEDESSETYSTIVFVSRECTSPEEATKVRVDDDRVVEIGKELKRYDYYDTGFFICKKGIFDYIVNLINNDEIQLYSVMNEVAKDGKLSYVCVDDFWIDIDTPEDAAQAKRLLKSGLQKADDGCISRHLNRRLSTRLTEQLSRFDSITPNHLTILSFSIGLLSSAIFFSGNVLLGGVMAQVCSVVDGCDGELARLKSMKTRFGGVFDAVTDRYVDVFILLGMLWAYGLDWKGVAAFFLAVTGSVLFSYTWHQTGIRVPFAGRDVRLFIIMVGALLSQCIGYLSTSGGAETLSTGVILLTMLSIGLLTHTGVVVSLVRLRGLFHR